MELILLQQYLPFTVLKHGDSALYESSNTLVATVLTVYGIETAEALLQVTKFIRQLQQYLPFTVLKL